MWVRLGRWGRDDFAGELVGSMISTAMLDAQIHEETLRPDASATIKEVTWRLERVK